MQKMEREKYFFPWFDHESHDKKAKSTVVKQFRLPTYIYICARTYILEVMLASRSAPGRIVVR